MDIIREKPQRWQKKMLFAALGVVIAGAVLAVALTTHEPAEQQVERDLIRMAKVKRGDFNIVVRATGALVPTDVRWLAAEVGGRVERVAVLPGAQVNPGDIIAELANPVLQQQLKEMHWDLEASEAQQRANATAIESRILDQELAELNAKNAYESAKMTYSAQQTLRKRELGSISAIAFETIRMETAQKKQHWKIEQRRSANLKVSLQAQAEAQKAQYNKLKKQMARLQQQTEELTLRAPMASVVQEVAIEPGQQIQIGSSVAKLVRRDQLIARIYVPEIQVYNVAFGQDVIIDTRKSQCRGVVERVSPSVIDGTVEVDVALSGGLPKEARPDLTVDAEINVARLKDAIYMDRPAFSQSGQTMRLFKVNARGDRAQRVLVEFGRGSASKIEIKAGLEPGDEVIISDQSGFSEYQVLALVN